MPSYWFLFNGTESSKSAQALARKFVAVMVGVPFWIEVMTEAVPGPEAGV